jgi:hypothetical protein
MAIPVAVDDEYSIQQDQMLEVAAPGVLENDTDADGDPLTAAVVSMPGNGNLALEPNGAFTYTPDAGFYGSDSFSYEANDGTDDSNVGVVSLTVTQYSAGDDNPGYSGGDYGALGPLTLLLLALAALYPRGLKPSKRRAISP